jgi:hypothetical protein
MKIARASLYLLKTSIVLYSESSDLDNGIWKAVSPFYKLPNVFNAGVVSAIKDVLENSKERMLFASDYSASKLLKQATGLTFGKLQAGAVKLVSLSRENGTITFSPNKTLVDNKGFVPLNEKSISVSQDATDNDILQTLQDVLSLCE